MGVSTYGEIIEWKHWNLLKHPGGGMNHRLLLEWPLTARVPACYIATSMGSSMNWQIISVLISTVHIFAISVLCLQSHIVSSKFITSNWGFQTFKSIAVNSTPSRAKFEKNFSPLPQKKTNCEKADFQHQTMNSKLSTVEVRSLVLHKENFSQKNNVNINLLTDNYCKKWKICHCFDHRLAIWNYYATDKYRL